MAIVLNNITSGYNISTMNANFQKIEDYINDKLLARADTGVAGEAMMERALDMNGNKILNVYVDVNDAGSLLTIGVADSRYYNKNGDSLMGPMNANGQIINNLPTPSSSSQAVPKSYVDSLSSTVESNYFKSLRFPDVVDEMAGVATRKDSIQGYNSVGKPVPVFAQTATADLALQLAAPTGAGLSGFNPALSYQAGTVGEYLATVPGADRTGIANSVSAFNAAIQKLALKGGGTLKPEPGVYLISGGSILWPSNIRLDLRGVTLKGDGANTLIKSGALVSNVLVDITPEYGTGSSGTGSGAHFVWRAELIGGVLQNAGLGIRGHRLNNGTSIRGTTFESSLSQAWLTSHSWGLRITECTVYAPAIMKDFVDWTSIENNSFEGNDGWNDGYAALTITTGGYGGSYSARIVNNGFHRMHYGIRLTCEMANLVVESNHFEAVVKQIDGDNNDKRHFRIKNNWMKANLVSAQSAATAVTPMSFGFLRESEIGPNRFTRDVSSPDYDYYINASSSNVFGNKIFVGYKTDADYSKYNLNTTNILETIRGNNSAATAFPEIDNRGGGGTYTVEKYKSIYHYVNMSIPNCTVTYSGTTCAIKTWIPWDPTGTGGASSFAHFHLNFLSASRSIKVTGRFSWNQVVFDTNKEIFGNSDVVTATLTNSGDGYTVITFSNVGSSGAVNGWIKEI